MNSNPVERVPNKNVEQVLGKEKDALVKTISRIADSLKNQETVKLLNEYFKKNPEIFNFSASILFAIGGAGYVSQEQWVAGGVSVTTAVLQAWLFKKNVELKKIKEENQDKNEG